MRDQAPIEVAWTRVRPRRWEFCDDIRFSIQTPMTSQAVALNDALDPQPIPFGQGNCPRHPTTRERQLSQALGPYFARLPFRFLALQLRMAVSVSAGT